ncbi:MAG: hypothetical protein KC425_16045, partial [Anaerolineales bacterium]|nr:hypothetical protein [Anaerolineales bacterium]
LDMVGWFHTHPALGVFYSSEDVVVHAAAFTLPWHVGLVVDPASLEAGFFGWINGQLAPFSGCYELLEQQAEPLMPWKVVRTAVWYDGAAEHEAEAPGHVYAPAGQGVAVLGVAPRTALIASLLAMLLTVVLAVGWLLPLTARVSRLETVALTLANQALADGNALACPDARVRILTPLTNTAVSAGTPVRIIGSAAVPDAARYRVELRPVGAETWALLRTQRQSTSLDQLALWDTADYLPGVYELRLTAVDRNNVRLSQTDLCLINLELLP